MPSRCCWPPPGGCRSTWTWSGPASGIRSAAGTIRRLRGQTLGLAGFGRIGQATGVKALGLGLRVLVCDPYRPAAEIAAAGAEPADWATLLGESDYLSLHVPLTPESAHLIDAGALRAMKPSAVLINTARGGLVDEAALAAAIRSGEIAGAALDVLAHEPPPGDDPLLHDPTNPDYAPHGLVLPGSPAGCGGPGVRGTSHSRGRPWSGLSCCRR